LFNAIAPDRRNDPEFGKMGAHRIDHSGLLTDEQMARAVEYQAALLLERLIPTIIGYDPSSSSWPGSSRPSTSLMLHGL
jgi:hypothetical protein